MARGELTIQGETEEAVEDSERKWSEEEERISNGQVPAEAG